jgi:hypothetical protein
VAWQGSSLNRLLLCSAHAQQTAGLILHGNLGCPAVLTSGEHSADMSPSDEELLLQTKAMMGDTVAAAQIEVNSIAERLTVSPEWLMEKAVLFQETGERFCHTEESHRFITKTIPNDFWGYYDIINKTKSTRRRCFLTWTARSPRYCSSE